MAPNCHQGQAYSLFSFCITSKYQRYLLFDGFNLIKCVETLALHCISLYITVVLWGMSDYTLQPRRPHNRPNTFTQTYFR